jgi:phage shock protein C
MKKKLTKGSDEQLFGVCSGLADYFNIDVTFVRIGFLIMLFSGIGLIPYAIFAIAMPEKEEA